MKLEINLPKFKIPTNPFISEGVKALAIVLGGIILIGAAVFVIKLFPKPKPAVLPASTGAETTVPEATEVPTEIPPTRTTTLFQYHSARKRGAYYVVVV